MMPYRTRLYWSNGNGIASLRGSSKLLTLPPKLHGQPVHMIEYLPMGDSVIARVQERTIDAPRDLLPDEVEQCLKFLAKMCGG